MPALYRHFMCIAVAFFSQNVVGFVTIGIFIGVYNTQRVSIQLLQIILNNLCDKTLAKCSIYKSNIICALNINIILYHYFGT
jgi:hypothetical protein